jgi:hypothetical protein
MTIYDRPTKLLMADWAREHLSQGQTFEKSAPISWFTKHYPKIKSNTVSMHVEGMAVNSALRKYHPSIRPGSDHDLFYKLGPNQFRLWDRDRDPAPLYKDDLEKRELERREEVTPADDPENEPNAEGAREFAFERDLRNYLVKNLSLIEPGLRLYDEEGMTGVEFPVGGRLIDILAVDRSDRYVVIELKVSRGHDRVIGQLLRYMGWVQHHMGTSQPVRGIIVANEITTDLKLAASCVPDIRLIEYQISFSLRPI